MDSLIDYVFSPSTLISIVTAIVWWVAARTALKGKVESLEKEVKELKSQDLHVKIVEMQKDIQYMREMFDRFIEWHK